MGNRDVTLPLSARVAMMMERYTPILDRIAGRCKIAVACDAELDEFVIVETYDDARELLAAISDIRALLTSCKREGEK